MRPGKELFKCANDLAAFNGSGNWVKRVGHVHDIMTHMRKAREQGAESLSL